MGRKVINKVGSIYGRLTVISIKEKVNGRPLWECRCECGNIIITRTNNLHSGNTRSCGCLKSDVLMATKRTHMEGRPKMRTKEYRTWANMKQRCLNQNTRQYKDYGGRGIIICERWDSYENFLADMGRAPSPGHSIDRENNDGNYEPSNCRWATRIEQQRNTRRSIRLYRNSCNPSPES